MKRTFIDHATSIAFVAGVFLILGWAVSGRPHSRRAGTEQVDAYVRLQSFDLNNPLHRALFRDAFSVFHPGIGKSADSLLRAIGDRRIEFFTKGDSKLEEGESSSWWGRILEIGGMYLNFLAAYVLILVITSYASRMIGIYLFVRSKQQERSGLDAAIRLARSSAHREKASRRSVYRRAAWLAFVSISTGILTILLFAPSYVIAYSVKSSFESASWVMMVLLGTATNGLLINHAYRFYTYLRHESRKGYVETGIAQNLHYSYAWNTPDGISIRAVLSLRKRFQGHVFQRIYENARFQSLPSTKELGTFLVTGLVIIEMALNIHGHLCYILLQEILFRHYDVALLIVFAIFLAVKGTEMGVDFWSYAELNHYSNQD
jgi:hypothetical protein